MEKMFILIPFLFSAFVLESGRVTAPEHRQMALSATSCSITSLIMDNVSECDDNGTANPFDDFFTADLFVEFVDLPTTGQLRVELGEDAMAGGGPMSIDVADITTPGSHVFEGIRFRADGTLTEVPVSFSAEIFCRETISDGPAVSGCSGSLPCEITGALIDNVSVCNDNGTASDPSDDFFTARVSVSFFNPPATGDLRITPGGSALPGGGATTVPVGSLNSEFGHNFTGVRFKANGTQTSIEVAFTGGACTRSVLGPTVQPCSAQAPPCTITVDFLGNPSACNDNGTPNDPGDDFYTQNIQASFFNRPLAGNLQIVPGGDAIGGYSIPVNQIIGNSHIFNNVQLKADGTPSILQMNFTANTGCIDADTGPTVQPCSTPPPPCTITVDFLGNPSACNNNGTPNDPGDDFYTQNIHASFFNRPLTGNLQIVPGGDAIGVYSIPVNQIIGNSHIFNNVQLKADGTPSILQMNFTDNTACIDADTGPTVQPCSSPGGCDLTITNVATTPESCPNGNNGSITVAATTSAGPLTYTISGPANQSNGTGIFTGLPDGNYSITVTDNGVGNCSGTAAAVVVAGTDQTMPSAICRNTTVTLDATGNYVLTTEDVFDQAASADNCGTVNFVGKSIGTVSCAQVGQTIPVLVTADDGNGNAATCTAQITVQEGTALPSGFSGDNVGNANGSNTFQACDNQQFTLTASGFSTSSADVQRLASRQLCGNGEIIAHVVSVSGGGWAGITLRETLAPGSKKVALKTQFSSNLRREIRTTTNGATNNLSLFRPQNTWLRLVRTGSNFTGYTSIDGLNWNFAFSTTVSMAGCIRAGLFSESINANAITTAVFDQVSVTGAAVPLVSHGGASVVAYEAPDFQAYPNPTTGELTLDLSGFGNRPVRLEINNVHGQNLKTLELNLESSQTERLELSSFRPGIYLVSAKSAGLPAVVKRIVLMDK